MSEIIDGKEIDIKTIARELVDGMPEYGDDREWAILILRLTQIMNEDNLTLKELRDMCWDDSVDIFDRIYEGPTVEIRKELQERGVDLSNVEFHQQILKDYQNSLWYGGSLASIYCKGVKITLAAYGDVIGHLINKKTGDVVCEVKDKGNMGSFYDMSIYISNDDELDLLLGWEKEHDKYDLVLDYGNWFEVTGEYKGQLYELGESEEDLISDAIIEMFDTFEDDYKFILEESGD